MSQNTWCCTRTLIFGLLTAIIWAVDLSSGQLVINVKNQGGDILQENLTSNVTDETVQLEFQKADGTLVTQFLDFLREVQIYRLTILSEEEGLPTPPAQQVPYRTVCFVMRLSKQDFIAADAIAKLRQKNPHTVRYPEEDHGQENSTFEYTLDLAKSQVISSHVVNLCREALGIYAQEGDLKVWAAGSVDPSGLLDAFRHVSVSQQESSTFCSNARVPLPSQTRVSSSLSSDECLCRLNFCIPWYPCGLKFCRGHDQSGKALSYRCGIKTCRKCLHYRFSARNHYACPWDD